MENKAVNSKDRYSTVIWDLLDSIKDEKQMESAFSTCLMTLRKVTKAEAGFLWMQDQQTGRLVIAACETEIDVTGVSIDTNQGAVGEVFSSGETKILSDAFRGSSSFSSQDDVTGMEINNQMIMPLNIPGGDVFGCIQLVNKQGGFTSEDSRIGNNISALISMFIDENDFKVQIRPKQDPLISLRDVIKEFQSGGETVRVLKGINLDIFPKEFLVILGESGCGKTTLMNIIGGMDSLSGGRLLVDGRDFSNPTDAELTEYRRYEIGYIFQSYHLMPNLSALENLEFIAEISRNPMSCREALALVGLIDKSGNFPSQMSGGQQQRVSIARALVKQPRVILADEPTAALDYVTSIEVLSIVEKIVREQGKTVVMITHNPEIAKMADRVVRLNNGKVSSIRRNSHPLPAKELVW